MDSGKGASWQDVPEVFRATWRTIFEASVEGEDLRGACPVCGRTTLHRWFDLHRASAALGDEWQGRGSQWQWCSSCHSYEHSSGLVPSWWVAPRSIEGLQLRHDPGPLEVVRQRAHERDAE